MEKQGIVTRAKGTNDARQIIVSLTDKGQQLQTALTDVPFAVGGAVACKSLTPETVPALFQTLDDMIAQLKKNLKRDT
jgi:DNA-binding MarR family transcriptional regulator